jgi:exopolysaccharide biosynthesis polyprenyl glycosylphosphotransferase
MLRLERKRCERSRDSFMLLLLEAPDLFQGRSGSWVLQKIARAISASTRETDVFGWYEKECTLGLIVSQVGPSPCANSGLVTSRIALALQESLPIELFDSLKLRVRIFPDDSDDEIGKGKEFTFYRDFSRNHDIRRNAHRLKRMIDIVVSGLALIALSPIMLLLALLVKCTSRGPVLFRQRRVGRYGAAFTFLKFRSMYSNNDPSIHREYVARHIAGNVHANGAEGTNKVAYKLVNDPRITPLGKILRKSSLDELPQLLNVLAGEMSLVGPRPPVPYEFERYDTWHKRRIFEVKPGITGLWQIKGRSKTTFDEMVRLDLRYIKAWSLWLDLKIILQTPRVVVSGDGAY